MSVPLSSEVRIALDWAKLWSPLAPEEERRAAWRRLGLPEPADPTGPDFVAAFVAGFPGPALPLQLHALLPGDPAAYRTTIVATARTLGCTFGERRLAPDHIALLCELLAVALVDGHRSVADRLLVELLLPWSEIATEKQNAAALPPRPRAILGNFAGWLRTLRHPT